MKKIFSLSLIMLVMVLAACGNKDVVQPGETVTLDDTFEEVASVDAITAPIAVPDEPEVKQEVKQEDVGSLWDVVIENERKWADIEFFCNDEHFEGEEVESFDGPMTWWSFDKIGNLPIDQVVFKDGYVYTYRYSELYKKRIPFGRNKIVKVEKSGDEYRIYVKGCGMDECWVYESRKNDPTCMFCYSTCDLDKAWEKHGNKRSVFAYENNNAAKAVYLAAEVNDSDFLGREDTGIDENSVHEITDPYAFVLYSYKQCLVEHCKLERCRCTDVSLNAAGDFSNDLGYGLYDVNGDGIKELIISLEKGSDEDSYFDDNHMLAMYTITKYGVKPVIVSHTGWRDDGFYLFENGLIMLKTIGTGYNGRTYSILDENGNLHEVGLFEEEYPPDDEDEQKKVFYHGVNKDDRKVVSKEEFVNLENELVSAAPAVFDRKSVKGYENEEARKAWIILDEIARKSACEDVWIKYYDKNGNIIINEGEIINGWEATPKKEEGLKDEDILADYAKVENVYIIDPDNKIGNDFFGNPIHISSELRKRVELPVNDRQAMSDLEGYYYSETRQQDLSKEEGRFYASNCVIFKDGKVYSYSLGYNDKKVMGYYKENCRVAQIKSLIRYEDGNYLIKIEDDEGRQYSYETGKDRDTKILYYYGTWNDDLLKEKYSGSSSLRKYDDDIKPQ